jgi:hypothetical protein
MPFLNAQGEAGAHDEGRGFGDRRGARRHHDLGHLGLGGDRRHGERNRGEAKARQHGDLVVDDEFLGEPLGDIGHAGIVLQDHLDLLAGDGGAVARLVELHGGVDLLAGRGLLAGHRQDQADLHGVLGESARGDRTKRGCDQEFASQHLFSSQTTPWKASGIYWVYNPLERSK